MNAVILITGASGGIGTAAAHACAGHGARIALHWHRNRKHAESVLAELPGNDHVAFPCDITDADAVSRLIDDVTARMGRLDVLVNNAGVSKRVDITRIDYATWCRSWRDIMDINLTGAANLSFCAAQFMIRQGGGRIVNVSSRGAFRGEPRMPWYGASKAGMNALGQSLAQALAPHKVFVYTVAPGFVATPMAETLLNGPDGDAIRAQSPLGRVARPEEIAETIRFLAMDAPELLTGCIVDANGASYLRS